MEREQQDWLSRPARRHVHITGTARLGDGSNLRVLVSNLSYQGCKVFCEKVVMEGDVLRLTVPGLGTIDAQVRWTTEDMAGLSFLLGNSVHEERRARLGF